MRVVLDTNILLVSIGSKSSYRVIFDAIIYQQIELVVSSEILNEYEEVISRKTNHLVANNILEMLISYPNVIFKEPYYNWSMIQEDMDDNKFIDVYLSSNSDYLVSNDHHFNILKTIDFPKVNLIN